MFSKSCKYAIRAVIYLATHSGESHKIGVKEVAEALDVPGPFLAKILQQLSKHSLISSTKGPSGGFYLSERDKSASMRKVVESIDGPDVFTSCILGLPVCSSAHPCPLHDQAMVYREGLIDMLTRQTIQDLAAKVSDEEVVV